MKKLCWIYFLLFCFILTACNNQDPIIEIEAKVTPINEEEYSKIGATNDLLDPKQEDFKSFVFDFNIVHANSMKDRKIEIFEDWKNGLNEIDSINRYRYGSQYSQDNENENFAKYHQEIIFYAKGLNDEEFKKVFGDGKIIVSWTNNNNENIEKEYDISNFVEFLNK